MGPSQTTSDRWRPVGRKTFVFDTLRIARRTARQPGGQGSRQRYAGSASADRPCVRWLDPGPAVLPVQKRIGRE
jgi:hypothetical protein